MPRQDEPSLQVVIASRLGDGRVVYLGAAGWTDRLGAAEPASSKEEAAALLARAQAAIAQNKIVDPYLTDIVAEAGGVRLKYLRERIRSQGPSVRPDLGYQAAEVS